MSWIHGYVGLRHDALEARQARAAAVDPAVEWQSDGVYLAAGGAYPTLTIGAASDSDVTSGGWIVAGMAFRTSRGGFRLVTNAEWNDRCSGPKPEIVDLDGHFCGVRIRPGHLDLFNDALGLRTLFIAQQGGGAIVSTRLDWLLQSVPHPTIDFEALGAQWCGRAELGDRTAFSGISRLGQGARAVIANGKLRAEDRPFALGDSSSTDFPDRLVMVVNPVIPGFDERSLACSGGLDSRVLLAAMLRNRDGLRLHNYGLPEHPDRVICGRLAKAAALKVDWIDSEKLAVELPAVQRTVTAIHAYAPASTFMDWRHYAALSQSPMVAIDGSLGEAGRCFFYRRMRSGVGREYVLSGNVEGVVRLQRQVRPGVFTPSIRAVMERGHTAAVRNVLETLPTSASLDQRVDLLMLRLEGPRYAGYAASHVDNVAVGYFPFAQPSLLRALLAMPPSVRRDGRLYRQVILSLAPELSRIPLARNGSIVGSHPFGLTGKRAALWVRAGRFTGHSQRHDHAQPFLRALETPIRDLVRSLHTRGFEAYDSAKLIGLIDGYFDGQHDDSTAVDRWLSFELWRLGVTGTWL